MYGLACLTLAVLLGASGPVLAQPGDNLNPLERYQENVKQTQLAAALGVDQTTVQRLLEIDRRYKAQKNMMLQDMKADLERLRQLLHQPAPPEDDVRQLLQTMFDKRQNTLNLQQEQLKEEMAILTPVQQARYLLFLIGLRQQMAQEARNLRPPLPGAGSPSHGVRGMPVVQPGR